MGYLLRMYVYVSVRGRVGRGRREGGREGVSGEREREREREREKEVSE